MIKRAVAPLKAPKASKAPKAPTAVTIAAAVAMTVVCAPATEAQEGESSQSSESSTESSSSELSPGAIVGITLGVLAAVGAAGVFAVQQGWLQLPPQATAFARQFGIQLPAANAVPARPGAKRGSCAASEFDALVPDWPHFTGTVVNYCDGQWAVASANQTDWMVRFRFVGGRWTVVPTDGVKQTGLTQGCYNGIKLREQGAPEEFIRRSPICTPAEIGTR